MFSRRAVAPLALSLVAVAVVSCGSSGDQRSQGRYCTEVGNHLGQLNSPAIATAADIDATLAAWRAVADAAPLAIEQEWTTMMVNLETAATVKPGDAASMQKVADTARASEPAANRVISYTFQLCGATIGKVTPVLTTTATSTTTTT